MFAEQVEHIAEQAKPFFFKGTNGKGVLLTHGFTGSPADLREFGEYLHQMGYTVLAPRLPGHGSMPEYLAKAHYQDWQASMNNALDELCAQASTVFALGNSFGGNLTYHLAVQRPGKIQRIITIGTPIWISRHHINSLILPVIKKFKMYVKKRWVGETKQSQEALKASGTYLSIPLPALHEMLKFISQFTRRELRSVTTPSLVMHSQRDIVIPKRSANYIFRRLGSKMKELRWIKDSYHNPFIDNANESFFSELERFFRREFY